MGCGWCGNMCGRQKECPGSWQQDHCPPKLTEVWLPWQGTGKSGTGWAWGGGQQVLITIFLRSGSVLHIYKEGILVRGDDTCKDLEAGKCLNED